MNTVFFVVFLRFIFGVFAFFLFDRTVDRQEMKLERERGGGGGSGKVREPGLEHGTPEGQRRYMLMCCPQGYRRRHEHWF